MMPAAPSKLTVPPPVTRLRRVMSSWDELPATAEPVTLKKEFDAARVTVPISSELFACWRPRNSMRPPRMVMAAASLRRSFRLMVPLALSKYKPP